MEWYTRTNQRPNLWSLAQSFDAPKQLGAKPGGNGRKWSCLSHPKAVTFSRLTENSPHHAEVAQAASSQHPVDSRQLFPSQLEQGRSKVFTTGQARFNPEHYVIKCVGGR